MEKRLDIAPISEWGMFKEPRPCVIAGPCSAESEEQVMETAGQLKAAGLNVFRAGIWKPRTHPGSFEGVGAPGLKWMQRAKKEFGLKISTEVASEKHVFECLKYGVDLVWLGARTTANPFLVQEIAEALRDVDIPVLVKNPVNADIDLWIGALERLNACGVRKLGVIHRGFSTFGKSKYRNEPGWQVAVELRTRYPELPFFCDPSHMGGSREYLREISQRSLDLGLEGLMIESHCNPSCALSDAKQQLVPAELREMLLSLTVRENDSDNLVYKENIDQLRSVIDVIDENLLNTFASRMKISRKIGEYKRDNNIAILQTARWDSILESMVSKGTELGLSEKFVTTVFNAIHEASVQIQNDLLAGK
ncbi:MAG: bifunctional 3-deoxy-7-phosphoheptulonate synthase/chorismate mutase type II [Bacteroidales bacterium]|nr:bifunctional 3-deoxy-7-phosphoheptulonate synthase/chorismate mutase type II [Bacteroides sp.]MCM1197549.1 bifunctional 3-deoxy-7-phosphoheptulonate synthase/chorismate mutase type II [Clostridium sp.]MCM1502236.1 bifunctional 3-deoxy-7-phosphoheptulonate synthase/chorismate mutase type II [Bacteroidales bacterium]